MGSHELTLIICGESGALVPLESEAVWGHHSLSMMGLPRDVLLTDEVVRIPFSVIIRPVDAAFHLQSRRCCDMASWSLVTTCPWSISSRLRKRAHDRPVDFAGQGVEEGSIDGRTAAGAVPLPPEADL